MTIEIFEFEDAQGNVDAFTTLDPDEARNYALRYGRKWIARIYEYCDSELLEDFTKEEE